MKCKLIVRLKDNEVLKSKEVELTQEEYEASVNRYSNWKSILASVVAVYGDLRTYFIPVEQVKYLYLEYENTDNDRTPTAG